ncbi:MAG: hypothetical protein BWY21_00318 [Parcubacteria group bacterium ADurb.Bin216]|nr:MAG: hypothetical protein BWY21_00318 [Parcubacteria group bacterium ADurb.Bin216]
MTQLTLGQKIVVGGGAQPPTYPIKAGMRKGKLISIEEGEREKMNWSTKPPTPTGEMEPSFKFTFAFKDDAGEVQRIPVETTQRVRTKGMQSTLFKLLKGLAPHPDKAFEDKPFVQALINDLNAHATSQGVGCYLNIAIKDNGWPKIETVLPLPASSSKVAVEAQTTIENDDIPF